MPLLDLPAKKPGLNFDKYAKVIANAIEEADPPRMTVGIFGGYGTGKSTLMEAIQASLDLNPSNEISTIPVNFQAWRHDHEDNLIVPFLLTLQHQIGSKIDSSTSERIKIACSAFLYGSSFMVNAGIAKFSFSAKNAITEEKKLLLESPIEDYTDAYVDIINYLRILTTDKESGQLTKRIVVFIDDLDRCFPKKALQLLEGIKAFTDIPGFVFVLALDPRVIDSFLQGKYELDFCISGTEYLEKMFIVLPIVQTNFFNN